MTDSLCAPVQHPCCRFAELGLADGGNACLPGPAQEAALAAFRSVPSRTTLVRVHIEPGYVLVMDGNTVHAGDKGVKGKLSPRMHTYVQRSQPGDSTVPVEVGMPAVLETIDMPPTLREAQCGGPSAPVRPEAAVPA